MKKKVAILGATGSIGTSALDILRLGKDDFEPVLFSSHRNLDGLLALSKEFPAAALVYSSGEKNFDRENGYLGKKGLLRAIEECGADIVLNGIAGAPGLEPSLAALKAGADLALANKETIVMASPLVFALAEKHGSRVIPVDSEHSAIFNLLEAHGRDKALELLLTASGGPFRTWSEKDLKTIGPQEALNHPTWNMGPKITIDSATLANKGLEVIEAAFLFEVTPDQIKVIIHPQSVVHSMVRLRDGAVYAQLSKPDMRFPIHNALYYPEHRSCSIDLLDFDHLVLEFEKPDDKKFPMLPLAYKAVREGGLYPAVYNAANEVAVNGFLKGKIAFVDIPRIVEYVMNNNWSGKKLSQADFLSERALDHILENDKLARRLAENYILELNG
ncbi:MAG: 1-deoxy-D-xylulose-5-phosphate reductoisomerase [Treponema sp.]|jgi:1-deoxy-D-xylulose-5-phosphate reductoisomerase|nr:1-deoxy-D-xylulose-5-phosphate reductoisomerase [Treponema sp.]